MVPVTPKLRGLVACGACGRQYDASHLAARSRFRCACGAVVSVPRFAAQDAAVVRCSACGAPRQGGAASCAHCAADFTARETDLHTLCPACMARISDRARFCHHCATPIRPQGDAGRQARQACPACGPEARLNARSLGRPEVPLLECPRCAGLWLATAVFEDLAARAQELTLPEPAPAGSGAASAGARSGGGRYRPCPDCGRLMHRRNYGRSSGVLLDSCKDHGVWFDAEELGAVLRWIREGGQARAAERGQAERRHAERQERMPLRRDERVGSAGPPGQPPGADGTDLLAVLLRSLFRNS
jgi:Zn-finger nucleic acid-binding protein